MLLVGVGSWWLCATSTESARRTVAILSGPFDIGGHVSVSQFGERRRVTSVMDRETHLEGKRSERVTSVDDHRYLQARIGESPREDCRRIYFGKTVKGGYSQVDVSAHRDQMKSLGSHIAMT